MNADRVGIRKKLEHRIPIFSTYGGYFGTYRPRAFYDFRGLLWNNMVETKSYSSLEDNLSRGEISKRFWRENTKKSPTKCFIPRLPTF
jgi:hypothetical protein